MRDAAIPNRENAPVQCVSKIGAPQTGTLGIKELSARCLGRVTIR